MSLCKTVSRQFVEFVNQTIIASLLPLAQRLSIGLKICEKVMLAPNVVCLILKKSVMSKSAFKSIDRRPERISIISDISPFWLNAKRQRLVQFSSAGLQRIFSMKSIETSPTPCPLLEMSCSILPLPLVVVPLRWPSVLVSMRKHDQLSELKDGPTGLLQMPWKLFRGHWYRTVAEMPLESWLNSECAFS